MIETIRAIMLCDVAMQYGTEKIPCHDDVIDDRDMGGIAGNNVAEYLLGLLPEVCHGMCTFGALVVCLKLGANWNCCKLLSGDFDSAICT